MASFCWRSKISWCHSLCLSYKYVFKCMEQIVFCRSLSVWYNFRDYYYCYFFSRQKPQLLWKLPTYFLHSLNFSKTKIVLVNSRFPKSKHSQQHPLRKVLARYEKKIVGQIVAESAFVCRFLKKPRRFEYRKISPQVLWNSWAE